MTTENDPKAAAPPDTAAETANEYDVPAGNGPDPTDGERAAATEEPAAELTFEEQLKAATDEAKRNYDSYLRSQAELQNVLKRHERELADRTRYEGQNLAKALLDVVDDLERALEHSDDGGSGLVDGVELVLKSLVAALENHGVERMDAKGQPFDPALHEAVAMLASAEAPAGTVIEEHRSGYRLRDRLLRAAMVVVAKAPGKDEEK
jgi:molecular chaperone GrpE